MLLPRSALTLDYAKSTLKVEGLMNPKLKGAGEV